MSLPQQPSPTYFGGLTNNPHPFLNPHTPVSITQAPVAKIEDYERSTIWYEKMKRKLRYFRNELKDSVHNEGKNKHNKAIIFGGTIIILAILVVIFVPIGVRYHAPEHRTNKGTPTTTPTSTSTSLPTPRVKYTDPENVIMATIPGAFSDGDDIDVMAVNIPEPESEIQPKAQPKSKAKAKSEAKSDTPRVLSSRTLRPRTGLAPPYFDSCKINQDCDWGYRCIENTCYPGCDSDNDCRKEHKCGHWKHDGPSDMYCMVKPHKDCRIHLEFCVADNDCCSGRCERVNGKKWRLCVPGIGRLDDSDLGLEEGEI